MLIQQPTNINFLSPLGFRFTLKRLPTVIFFAVGANIPGFSFGSTNIPTPFKSIPIQGDHLEFEDFQLTFKVDEDMGNIIEIHKWMRGLGFPDNFKQYKWLKEGKDGSHEKVYSDGTLTILNSAMAPNLEVRFQDMFPTNISSIDLTTQDPSVNYVTATVTFKYKVYELVKI